MFTSRAEYRLSLRADNADQRLTPRAIEIGCVGEGRRDRFETWHVSLANGRELLKAAAFLNRDIAALGIAARRDGAQRSAYDLLAQPDVTIAQLATVDRNLNVIPSNVRKALENEGRYAVYMDRQAASITLQKREEETTIPEGFDYADLGGLSNELRQKLVVQKPRTIAHAAKMDGMTPAAVALIIARLRRNKDPRSGAAA